MYIIKGFGIHLKVTNITTSYRFYKLFDFQPVFVYGNKIFTNQFNNNIAKADEKYHGIVFNINGTIFEIADGHLAVKPQIFKNRVKNSKISAMLYVNSVETIVKICQKNSIPIIVNPKIYPWGTREVVIKDPDGFVLVFIEKLPK